MLNQFIGMGRLTKDVEIRKTQSQKSVASFTIAIDGNVKKGTDGQPLKDEKGFYVREPATFVECVAWNQLADRLGTYAKKGSRLIVNGRIQTRNYDDAQGVKHYVTEVVAMSAEIVDKVERTGDSPANANNQAASAPAPETDASSLDISSDDLPF
jgi:single-strand DNA-binding protein